MSLPTNPRPIGVECTHGIHSMQTCLHTTNKHHKLSTNMTSLTLCSPGSREFDSRTSLTLYGAQNHEFDSRHIAFWMDPSSIKVREKQGVCRSTMFCSESDSSLFSILNFLQYYTVTFSVNWLSNVRLIKVNIFLPCRMEILWHFKWVQDLKG